MTKKELLAENEKLNKHNNYLRDSLEALVKESMRSGEHLKNEVFIPEYLGMEESEIEDNVTGVTMMRVYSKNGFNISKMHDDRWVILNDKKEKSTVAIENMFEGILALKMSGMDINFEVLTKETKTMDKIEKFLGIEDVNPVKIEKKV
jgi:hypothetical protein